MKKIIITCATLMVAALGVYGQGALGFANNGNTQIKLPNGTPATTAASIWIGLFYSTVNGQVATPLTQASDQFTFHSAASISSVLQNGVFSGGNKSLGPEAAPAWIQIRIWDKALGSGAAGYWNAVSRVNADPTSGWAFFKFSDVLAGTLGTASSGATPLVGASGSFGFTGLTVDAPLIPEPSILALGLLGGLGTLVLIRRRQ